jgi:hypothetical protein
MIRAIRIALVLCAVASCGGDESAAGSLADGGTPGAGGSNSGSGGTDNQGAGGGNTGTGGTTGSGGHSAGASGAGGFETDGLCAPMAGCASHSFCTIGCNDYRCSGTVWISTNRCNLDAQTDAPTGVCNQDSDCEFRKNVACCGVCLARTDPSPGGACPPGAGQCAPYQPNCVCIDHKCGTGTLTQTQSCTASHDLCGLGLKCCPACVGPAGVLDASACSRFACSIAYSSASGTNSCSL